jgi:high-affinity K+ transport system ATPase subunit B
MENDFKNTETKATTQMLTKALEDMNKGQQSESNLLVFDPESGEFVLVSPNDVIPADATTIDSIAKDGFAAITKINII